MIYLANKSINKQCQNEIEGYLLKLSSVSDRKRNMAKLELVEKALGP